MSTEHEDVRVLLGAYVLGGLDDTDLAAVQSHLPTCALCRDELAQLAVLPGLLRRRPAPTDLPAAAPKPPAELLPALLHELDAGRRRDRRRWLVRSAVAAVTVATLTAGAGAVLAREDVPVAGAPVAGTPVAGTPVALVAATGVTSGHARLLAKPWGTSITVELRGLPRDGRFVLQTTGRDGTREQAAAWGATSSGAVTVVGATSLDPTDLTRVAVLGAGGRELAGTNLLNG
ncbi:MAG: zf-HC2 domain-containing protein [Actinomycetota bacterium]